MGVVSQQTFKEKIKGSHKNVRPHHLSEYELDFSKDEQPEKVFIGTGQNGDLPFHADCRRHAQPVYDMLKKEHRSRAPIIHVTC